MDKVYGIKLHETAGLGGPENILVLRVPGGWIYTFYCESGNGGYDMSSCFVPWDNEFQMSTAQRGA